MFDGVAFQPVQVLGPVFLPRSVHQMFSSRGRLRHDVPGGRMAACA